MFESVKQGNRLNTMMYFISLLVSLAVHAAILFVMVVVPLVFFNVLHADELVTILIDPPAPPAQPPPSPPITKKAAIQSRFVSFGSWDFAPQKIPVGISPADENLEPIGVEGIVRGIGDAGRHTEEVLGILNEITRKELPKLAEPKRPDRLAPVWVGGNLQESKLILKVNPVYPELARRAHVSGSVVLEAMIDEEGNVSTLKVLSGHPLLTEAAVQAVKQWKYSPTVLNGEPIAVLAMVTVVFQIR